ncbi:hypothetical protein BAMA111019_22295 [Bacillus manliponensis]
MTQKTCNEMISHIKNMKNDERISFLHYLFDNHFDSRPIKYNDLDTRLVI